MSVFVTLRVPGDPAAFEREAKARAEVIERIIGNAKSAGCISHRWFGTDDAFMAVDEWPDAESFQSFFEGSQADIGPLMEAVGVTGPPEVTVWRAVDIDDEI